MSSDIHQMGGFYDAATQQNAFKAMSQMWQMDQYHQGYPMKDIQTPTTFPHPFANFAQQLSSITSTMRESPSSTTSSNSKKKPNPVPVELKDEAYYERRKRNNESARRSREARRQKEDINFRKLELVQQDNLRLKAELQRVLMELERLKYMAAVQGVQL
ncbi:basic region leucine zipper [Teladorsagia circumcincta]|uniref:Basic region leucine zipper n=1 Tax=Teladorsagia circumcincta TaxID=45464 RepID=A0A2G9TUD9_TELCI|nr:basic region leucine zipper [Teladorsagia circumcincta]